MQLSEGFDSSSIIRQVEEHCRSLFALYNRDELVYHNINHTQLVVRRVTEIAQHYPLTELEMVVLITSAWFHDTGQLIDGGKDHEKKSVDIMLAFCAGFDIKAVLLNQIAWCILATKLPGRPQNLLQMILCDADLYHLGTDDFIITNELVKKEIEIRYHTTIPNWLFTSMQFSKNHTFFTKYCSAKLTAGKRRNIEQLQKMIQANEDFNC